MTRWLTLPRPLGLALAAMLAVGCVGEVGNGSSAEATSLGEAPSGLGTAFNHCGAVITGTENATGQYFLSSDLDLLPPPIPCFEVIAPGRTVTMDCGGHVMRSDFPLASSAFNVAAGTLVLRNCVTEDVDRVIVVAPQAKAVIMSGTYRGTRASGARIDIWGGQFRLSTPLGAAVGVLRVFGGDFSLPGGIAVQGATIHGGRFHDSNVGALDSDVFAGDFYSNLYGLQMRRAAALAGGHIHANGTGLLVSGGAVDVIDGTFDGNRTDLRVINAAFVDLNGGTMCDLGKTNIDVRSGTLVGDDDSTRARCRTVAPAGIYSCHPCAGVVDE